MTHKKIYFEFYERVYAMKTSDAIDFVKDAIRIWGADECFDIADYPGNQLKGRYNDIMATQIRKGNLFSSGFARCVDYKQDDWERVLENIKVAC